MQIDIFNTDMYRQLINTYNTYLSGLKKYIGIHTKLYGYFDNNEISYIINVYYNLFNDLINSHLFSLFVPNKSLAKIKNELMIINNLQKSKNYERIIIKLESIQKMITINELLI